MIFLRVQGPLLIGLDLLGVQGPLLIGLDLFGVQGPLLIGLDLLGVQGPLGPRRGVRLQAEDGLVAHRTHAADLQPLQQAPAGTGDRPGLREHRGLERATGLRESTGV